MPSVEERASVKGTWGRCCNSDETGHFRISFDKSSYVDLWYNEQKMWCLSAQDLKEDTHKVVDALLQQTEASESAPPASADQGKAKEGPATHRPSEHADVGETTGILGFRGRLRLSSAVLHFRAKGLRPGTFLLMVPQEGASSEVLPSDGATATALTETSAEKETWDTSEEARGMNAPESCHGAETPESRIDGAGLWVTEESTPLLPRLCQQWGGNRAVIAQAPAAAAERSDESYRELSSTDSQRRQQEKGSTRPCEDRATGKARVTKIGPCDVEGDGGEANGIDSAGQLTFGARRGRRQTEAVDFRRASPRGDIAVAEHAPRLTLRAIPSARTPVPALSCGVCGSSWETDGLGKGFRAYHIAVANHASLVWSVRRRFSEFLTLHTSLASSDDMSRRLPSPPKRTFGLMKAFPENMERFRRDQLDAYLQELLSIPEALGNRSLLSFLGLLSTSRHELMSPPDPRRTSSVLRIPPRYWWPFVRSCSPSPSGPTAIGCGRSRSDPSPRSRSRLSASAAGELPQPAAKLIPTEGPNSGVVSEGRTREEGFVRLRRCHAEHSDTVEGSAYERRESGRVGLGSEADGKSKDVLRRVERISTLEQAAQGGDIVLFRCRGLLSRLQRWASRSEWDHVGMVVPGELGEPLRLMEATPEGVRLYPLVERLRAYQDQQFAFRVAFRLLDSPRPVEARSLLVAFARKAEGKGYGVVLPFHQCRLAHRSPTRGPPAEARTSSTTRHPELPEDSHTGGASVEDAIVTAGAAPAYLCSQLVGAALLEMGVLRRASDGRDGAWAWLLPGAFARGGSVDRSLAAGVTLSEEIMVDGHEPEVASAVLFRSDTSSTQAL